jgi:hypothetical protein
VANNHSASWDINGANGTMYAGVIKENLLSAFASSDATMLLRLRNCRGTLVEDNTFLNGAGASTAIDIGSDCQDVRIGANTFNSGISVKVNDAGVGTMGVVKAATLENSWVAYNVANETLQFIKSSDGMVHVYGSIASGTATTGTRVTQLPTGFRPSKIVTALIMQSNGTVDAIARATIESDGSVRIQGVSTTTRVDFKPHVPGLEPGERRLHMDFDAAFQG